MEYSSVHIEHITAERFLSHAYLFRVFFDRQLLHEVVKVQDGTGLQVFDEGQKEILHLLGTVLKLGSLPDHIYLLFRDL